VSVFAYLITGRFQQTFWETSMEENKEFISVQDLLVMYENTLDAYLLPLDLVADFNDFDSRRGELASKETWERRREQMKPKVDKMITRILCGEAGESISRFLRKMAKEALLFYFERILVARNTLEQICGQHPGTMFPLPPSAAEFWIDFLVTKHAERI
jgi:hypothetical protein